MAKGKSVLPRPDRLSEQQRASIFDKTAEKVTKQYFDPGYNGTDWPRRAKERRDQIVATEDPEQFELTPDDARSRAQLGYKPHRVLPSICAPSARSSRDRCD